MITLLNEHGWSKYQFFGGGMPDTATPEAPSAPAAPAPAPTKTDEDVQQEAKAALEQKKFQRGREKTLLAQTSSGTKKKTLLGS